MLTKTLFKRAFLALAATAVLNWIAIKFYLYWTVWGADSVVHFFGGMCAALAVLWIFSEKSELKNWSRGRILFAALGGAFLVGVLWEIFELHFGITALSDGARYFSDTASDLLMDALGGAAGFFSAWRLLKKYEK
jgi:hypothetical protein